MEKRLDERIYTYNRYIQRKFGRRVFRVGLSTGIQCPHRLDERGCIFCSPRTYTGEYLEEGLEIRQQLERGIKLVREACGEVGILAYFQEDTSTAGEIEYLKRVFSEALDNEKVLGLVVSTRPDYISSQVTGLLGDFDFPVTIEIGMQSIHDKSLDLLNRGHDFKAVERAIELCGEHGLETGVHLIMGIPGETRDDMQSTVKYVSENPGISQVKFHNLVVYDNTPLAEMYRKGEIEVPSVREYIPLLAELLPYLRGNIVISRLFTSSIRRLQSAAPEFRGVKTRWMNELRKYIYDKDIRQGSRTGIEFDPDRI